MKGSTSIVWVTTPKRNRRLRVKDFSMDPTLQLDWDSNQRPSGLISLDMKNNVCQCLCHWISFVFFSQRQKYLYYYSFARPSLSHRGEFQDWEWIWYQLTCGPRGGSEVQIEHKSRSKCLPWPGFESQTSHLAVQPATARPRRTPSQFNKSKLIDCQVAWANNGQDKEPKMA